MHRWRGLSRAARPQSAGWRCIRATPPHNILVHDSPQQTSPGTTLVFAQQTRSSQGICRFLNSPNRCITSSAIAFHRQPSSGCWWSDRYTFPSRGSRWKSSLYHLQPRSHQLRRDKWLWPCASGRRAKFSRQCPVLRSSIIALLQSSSPGLSISQHQEGIA